MIEDRLQDGRLQEVAKRLGSSAAERLDVDAVARNVVARLREQPTARPVWQRPEWLRIAAALVVLIGGAVAVQRSWPGRGDADHSAHFVADDLSDLSTDQLRDMLGRFDELVGSTGGALPENGADLHELDAQQLRQMLRSLEG
jgi:hypothetical protein